MTGAGAIARELYRLAEADHVPLDMTLELTHRCNERCLHCYLGPPPRGRAVPRLRRSPATSPAADPPTAGGELGTDEWLGVLGELAAAGTLSVTFTGGEVLLREDLAELLGRARRLAFNVRVLTNATLLSPGIADEWARLAVAATGVSVYGACARTHDGVTGLAGSFERTVAGARLLAGRDIRVELKCPLMEANLGEYPELIALAASMGATARFDPVLTPRNDGARSTALLGLADEGLRRVYSDERLSPAEDVLSARAPEPGEPACGAGRTSGAVGPYGDVLPCIQWLSPAGNVRLAPFREIWERGRVLARARAWTYKDVKPCPDCGGSHLMHCPGLGQLERGDPLAPPEDCCRATSAILAARAGKERI